MNTHACKLGLEGIVSKSIDSLGHAHRVLGHAREHLLGGADLMLKNIMQKEPKIVLIGMIAIKLMGM
jgi:hypothetical protein